MWEVRVFAGRDAGGRPRQLSRTVRGTKKDAQRVAAGLALAPVNRTAGRTVADALDAWIDASRPTWAISSARDQAGRAALVKADRIAELPLARLDVGAVERWHARLGTAGVGESSIVNRHQALRAALAQAQRWGWVSTNPAALARLRRSKAAPREAMSSDEVAAVLAAAEAIGPRAHLALRLAALTGARRSELAARRWDDVLDGRVRIDSRITTVRGGGAPPVFVDGPTKTA
ncbi:MAG: hypothetical protein ACRD0H_30980, partial [Actinomycetes bacterium]